jgi:hypothetical protein
MGLSRLSRKISMNTKSNEMLKNERKEEQTALEEARTTKKTVKFIAYDGCEVTVFPNGVVFYNAADWW